VLDDRRYKYEESSSGKVWCMRQRVCWEVLSTRQLCFFSWSRVVPLYSETWAPKQLFHLQHLLCIQGFAIELGPTTHSRRLWILLPSLPSIVVCTYTWQLLQLLQFSCSAFHSYYSDVRIWQRCNSSGVIPLKLGKHYSWGQRFQALYCLPHCFPVKRFHQMTEGNLWN
jgi:hypothetical protein